MLLLSFLKAIGPPGSLGFLLLLIGVGLAFMFVWPRRRRLGRLWIAGAAGTYLILSVPLVANGIADLLPRVPTPDLSSQRIDTILFLGGDNSTGRIRETARLYRVMSPTSVKVMDADWVLQLIVEQGLPRAKVDRVPNAGDTRVQIQLVDEMLADKSLGRVALIASRFQAPRIQGLLNARKVRVLLVGAPADREPPTAGLGRLIPDYGALCVSRDALYEHAALVYYRWRGWI